MLWCSYYDYKLFPELDCTSFCRTSKLLGDDFGCDPEVPLHGLGLGQVVVCINERVIVLADDDVDALGIGVVHGVHTHIVLSFLAACEALSWQRSS